MSDPFSEMEGKDGFHVVKTEVGKQLSLYAIAVGCGELAVIGGKSSVEVWTIDAAKDTHAHGAWTRLHLVLDAIARYLTTGGNWQQLDAAVERLRSMFPGGLDFAPYFLLDSYLTDEGTYQHVFAAGSKLDDKAVLWEEPMYNASGGVFGGFIDHQTVGSLVEADRGAEEDEGDEKTKTDGSSLPALPGRRSAGTATDND